MRYVDYEKKLVKLQTELIRLQTWAIEKNERIIILFQGRDAAGKGGAIRRVTERINPRHMRIVALPKPTIDEQSHSGIFKDMLNNFRKQEKLSYLTEVGTIEQSLSR